MLRSNDKRFSYNKEFYRKEKEKSDGGWDFLVTDELLDTVADKLGFDYSKYDREQLRKGLEQEKEHGSQYVSEGGEAVNLTKNNPVEAGRIAFAHIIEIPDYYTRLDEMEEEAKEEKGTKEEESDGEHPEY
jgi:hypothetical protein